MIRFDSILHKVSGHASQAPKAVIMDAFRTAAREICEEAKVWEFHLPRRNLTAGVASYDYDELPEGAQVNTITRARINGEDMKVVSRDEFDECFPLWPDVDMLGQPTTFAHDPNNADDETVFIVEPVPDGVMPYTVAVSMTLVPTRDALGLPSDLMDKIEDALVSWGLHSALVIPRQPWSNTELASFHGRQYRSMVNRLRADQNLSAARRASTVINPGTW